MGVRERLVGFVAMVARDLRHPVQRENAELYVRGLVEQGGRIRALRQDTAGALERAGFEIEPDFRPHLTLGRARRLPPGAGREALERWYAVWKDHEFGPLPVESVHLMRSRDLSLYAGGLGQPVRILANRLGRVPDRHAYVQRLERRRRHTAGPHRKPMCDTSSGEKL